MKSAKRKASPTARDSLVPPKLELVSQLGNTSSRDLEHISNDLFDHYFKRVFSQHDFSKAMIVKLIGMQIKKKAFDFARDGYDLEDCIQEALVGAISGIKHFKKSRIQSFSAVIHWYVLSALFEYRHHSNSVYLPREARFNLKLIISLQRSFLEMGGKEVSWEEISKQLGLPLHLVQNLICLAHMSSLNEPLSQEEPEEEIIDMLTDGRSNSSPEHAAELSIMRFKIKEALYNLNNERIQLLIERRYGLLDGRCWTLDELEAATELPKSTIRYQIEKGLEELRSLLPSSIVDSMLAD